MAKICSSLMVLFVIAELACRFVFGLGDPPLSYVDRQMEYLWKPSQTCYPFHHFMHFNAYSMRSGDFPVHKSDPSELRVMVIGDSVVYDGTQIDQKDICTEVLRRTLSRDLHRKVTVGNIAARSWGPPNELAYIKNFGLFDADWVILVLSSHDYADVPTFHPIVDVDPNYPGHKPILALWEVLYRYLPRYLPQFLRPYENPNGNPSPTQKDIDWSLSCERQIFKIAREGGAKVILAQMLERGEINGRLQVGHQLIFDAAMGEGVASLEIGDLFAKSVQEGRNPYLDVIHPNVLGCKIMGESMAHAVESFLR